MEARRHIGDKLIRRRCESAVAVEKLCQFARVHTELSERACRALRQCGRTSGSSLLSRRCERSSVVTVLKRASAGTLNFWFLRMGALPVCRKCTMTFPSRTACGVAGNAAGIVMSRRLPRPLEPRQSALLEFRNRTLALSF